MKSISNVLVALCVLLSFTVANAQVKNSKIETVKIYGNCAMCKNTIETAGTVNKVAKVDWDENLKSAVLTYDTKQTTRSEILKRIALAGYDSDEFLAPDEAYAKLPACCQYERAKQTVATVDAKHENHTEHMAMTESNQSASPLQTVFDHYFAVKDALVKTDGATASTKAAELLASINAVKMETLEPEAHKVWMKVVDDLKADAKLIADSKEVNQQRIAFIRLSENMYALIKVADYDDPVYYQYCPMANNGKGANWLSKENVVKNPYYGNQMLSCGSVQETIE